MDKTKKKGNHKKYLKTARNVVKTERFYIKPYMSVSTREKTDQPPQDFSSETLYVTTKILRLYFQRNFTLIAVC